MALNLSIQSDHTVRTVTLVPRERTLLQYDPYFKDPNTYEVQRVIATIEEVGGDGIDVTGDQAIDIKIKARRVGKSGQYVGTYERDLYNSLAIERAEALIRNLLSLEADL